MLSRLIGCDGSVPYWPPRPRWLSPSRVWCIHTSSQLLRHRRGSIYMLSCSPVFPLLSPSSTSAITWAASGSRRLRMIKSYGGRSLHESRYRALTTELW